MSIKWGLIEYGNLQGQDDETYGSIYEIVVLAALREDRAR